MDPLSRDGFIIADARLNFVQTPQQLSPKSNYEPRWIQKINDINVACKTYSESSLGRRLLRAAGIQCSARDGGQTAANRAGAPGAHRVGHARLIKRDEQDAVRW